MGARYFDLKNHSKADGYKTFIHAKSENLDLHYHEYYEVFLTETDGIVHVINGVEEVLSAGSLVFVRPSDTHKLYFENDFCYINFNFSATIFERLMEYLDDDTLRHNLLSPQNSPVAVLNEPEREKLHEKIRRVGLLQEMNDKDGALYMRRTLLDILITYFAEMKNEEKNEMPYWLQYTLRQMQKPVNFEKGIPRMVEISGKTLTHLGRSMQKYKGMKPTEYINRIRVQYVASMLVHSDMTILDIAMESGFQSEAHFYKLFSEYMGMSPKQYRERYKN